MEFNFPPRPSVRQCIARIAGETGVAVDQILGRSRKHNIVVARQAAMYEATKRSGRPLTVIGRVFGRDHSTIIHGVNQHATRAGLPKINRTVSADQKMSDMRHMAEYWKAIAMKLQADIARAAQ